MNELQRGLRPSTPPGPPCHAGGCSPACALAAADGAAVTAAGLLPCLLHRAGIRGLPPAPGPFAHPSA